MKNMDIEKMMKESNIDKNEIKQIVCGDYHTFILKNNGSVWACGYNNHGRLGLGDTDTRYTFTQVTTNINNDVTQIACGYNHTFILKNDGSVYSCGFNGFGQLGLDSTTTYRTTFTKVTTNIDNDVKQIACGLYYTFILKNDGSVWACGYNGNGKIGLGTTDTYKSFTKVTTNINNDVKQIACGSGHTFILKNNGSVYSCGDNECGQLGSGYTTNRTSFKQVTTNVSQIACGCEHTFILKNDGSVWACGYNGYGQLGLGDTTTYKSFTQVTTNIDNDVKQIACGKYYTFILKNDGSVYSCGANGAGQLGLSTSGSSAYKTSFKQVTTNINNDVKQIACGYSHVIILKNDGSIYSCGNNYDGQLGLGDTTDTTSFIQVTTNIK